MPSDSAPKGAKKVSRKTGAVSKTKAAVADVPYRAPLTISRPELLVHGSDRDFRRLVHNLFAFGSRHEAMRAGHGARIGLTGIEYTFLVSVRHLEDDGDVSVKLLADHLHLSGPFSTTMIGKLIRKGLIAKDVDPADRRRVRLKVTRKGHELLATLAPAQRQVNDVQFSCLSAKDFQYLLLLLEKLIDCGDQALALQSYLAMNDTPPVHE